MCLGVGGGAYAHTVYMECLILVGKTFARLKFQLKLTFNFNGSEVYSCFCYAESGDVYVHD